MYRAGKQHTEAVAVYRQALSFPLKDGSIVLDAISCANQAGDGPAATFFMEKGLRIGLTSADYRRLWPSLGHGAALDSLLAGIDTAKAIEAYRAALKPDLIERLQVLQKRDQAYRSDSNDNPALQRLHDSLYWQVLRTVSLELGRLPYMSEMGFEGSDHLKTLFYHMDLEQLRFFLPYAVQNNRTYESNLCRVILYQLDRIGMAEGILYNITNTLGIEALGKRTVMKNGMPCQAYGEFLDEQDPRSGEVYATPLDPTLPVAEINRMRNLLCQDGMDSRRKRKPWAKVTPVEVFESVFNF